MAKRIGGIRRKTRHKLARTAKERGKINLSSYFQKFSVGDVVLLKPNPAIQTGLFPFNFVGRHGVICGEQGKCYQVMVRDGGKEKVFIVHPVHMRVIRNE
ncbi:MAG: 50S ribosomal protein L21e [Candidatus Woesearchaeota archaeon]|nr:50S ribosomal protein L21e [Candidatus Woesearchaeota archaeon]